jgi:hypothetical protein
MAREIINKDLGKGIVTIPSDPELIPQNTSQDSIGWISTDGQIELCKGRLLIGAEETANGYVKGEGWGYRADGTAVHFRKVNTKIQYYNTTTSLWVDIVTGLTDSAEYCFSKTTTPAGNYVYVTGVDGIYKINVANPGSYTSMYDSTKNWKGKSIIGTAGEFTRMFMWDLPNDKTGLYISYLDKADSSVYTHVTAEATAAATSGTLAFKGAGATRTCFQVYITITAGGEVFSDDRNGNLVGSAGGTGTINYTTGAWTLSVSSAGTADYYWENSNVHGVTDFTFSGTRTAGQGLVLRQDDGGDPIQMVESYEGVYYSIKKRSVYSMKASTTAPYIDLQFDNNVYRKDIGMPYWRASVTTGKGIIFMNTSNLDKPQLTILQKNINGDNLEPVTLANHFDFSNYIWDATEMSAFGEFIVFSGRTSDSTINNKLFFYNVRRDTVDILHYGAKTITSDEGLLYIGDTQTDNIYEILSGFDDDNDVIENYWISNDERYGIETLKKVKRLRLKGIISASQILEVYVSYDGSDYVLVGTVLGTGDYVDGLVAFTIGSQGIGTSITGGDTSSLSGNFYFAELKISTPKFRKRSIKLKATGVGYISVNLLSDFDLRFFNQKLPSKYRVKQNVSVDGTLTDQ